MPTSLAAPGPNPRNSPRSRRADPTLARPLPCAQSFCGTPAYLSPEMVATQPYTEKTDVWALGVLLYELLALQLPFPGRNLVEISNKISAGTFAPLPTHVSAETRELVAAALQLDAKRRPSVAELQERADAQIRAITARREREKAEKEKAAAAAAAGGPQGVPPQPPPQQPPQPPQPPQQPPQPHARDAMPPPQADPWQQKQPAPRPEPLGPPGPPGPPQPEPPPPPPPPHHPPQPHLQPPPSRQGLIQDPRQLEAAADVQQPSLAAAIDRSQARQPRAVANGGLGVAGSNGGGGGGGGGIRVERAMSPTPSQADAQTTASGPPAQLPDIPSPSPSSTASSIRDQRLLQRRREHEERKTQGSESSGSLPSSRPRTSASSNGGGMHGGMGGAMGVGIPLPQGGASGGYSERDVQAYVLAEQIARLHADEIGRDERDARKRQQHGAQGMVLGADPAARLSEELRHLHEAQRFAPPSSRPSLAPPSTAASAALPTPPRTSAGRAAAALRQPGIAGMVSGGGVGGVAGSRPSTSGSGGGGGGIGHGGGAGAPRGAYMRPERYDLISGSYR